MSGSSACRLHVNLSLTIFGCRRRDRDGRLGDLRRGLWKFPLRIADPHTLFWRSFARIFTPGGERGTHPGPTFLCYLGARKIRPLLLARVQVSIVSDVATVTFMRPHDGHLGVRFDVGLIFQFRYS